MPSRKIDVNVAGGTYSKTAISQLFAMKMHILTAGLAKTHGVSLAEVARIVRVT
jgi:hypothetical protein